jgi:integrase
MRQGSWSPAYRKINIYEIGHYLVDNFGRIPMGQLGTFEIQVWLNKLATKFSQSVVRHCYVNIRSIMHMAKKMNFVTKDPAEDVTMPQTTPVEKPLMAQEQILALIGGIQDLHDLCLMYVGLFCGPRSSEVLGLQWKSWTGTTLVPHGTAFEGRFYPGRLKTRSSRAPIGVPEQVRPIIQAWHQACPDPSPEALMFSTFGRGERKGQAVPRWGKNFLRWRVRPIARKLGIPDRLVTFQVMRRTLGNQSSTSRHTQGCTRALRHASIRTTGDVYVQTIEASVLNAMNSGTFEILSGWKPLILNGSAEVTAEPVIPKRRQRVFGVLKQLDQLEPSSEAG